jgi:hypothetical protein
MKTLKKKRKKVTKEIKVLKAEELLQLKGGEGTPTQRDHDF